MTSEPLEVHSHYFVSGQRSKSGYGKDGKWHIGGEQIRHSHPGGGNPHSHPETGPAFYGYRTPKVTKRPNGEQLELIPATEDESSFDLVITDSALMSVPYKRGEKPDGKTTGLIPIGNTPVEALGFPAADTMMRGFRLKCNVRDERKGGAA